jgi:similar to stage IV sporulation protein
MKLFLINSYVCLCVDCDTECFLKDLKREKVTARNVRKNDEGVISFSVNLYDYQKLVNSNFVKDKNVKVIKFSGVINILEFVKRNVYYCIGIGIFVVLLLYLSSFLWKISYVGNYRITSYQLDSFLQSKNVMTGISKKKISCKLIERKIREKYDCITWVSAEIIGTNLIIHIKENMDFYNNKKNNANSDETKNYCDIVSKSNSVIESIIVRNGIPMVKKGDIVKPGDILITGSYPLKDDYDAEIETKTLAADGDIIGRTIYKFSTSFDRKIVKRNVIKNGKGIYYISLNSKTVMGEKIKKGEYIISKKQPIKFWGSFYVPIYLGYKKKIIFDEKNEMLSDSETKKIANDKVNDILRGMKEKRMQILQKSVNIYVGKSDCSIKGTITVLEPINKIQKINNTEGTTTSNEHN